jgi:hypothetical protein
MVSMHNLIVAVGLHVAKCKHKVVMFCLSLLSPMVEVQVEIEMRKCFEY